MITSILCIFETFQTFITGLLSFTGVIITMVVNAENQRELQIRQIKHDVRSLRVALKSELLANKKSYEGRIQQFNEPSDYADALIPNNTVDGVYQTLLNKIGLLSEEEVENVHNAYLLMGDLPYRLRILAGTDNIGGHNDEFIRLKRDQLTIAADMHKNFLPNIVEAIDSINHQLSNQDEK